MKQMEMIRSALYENDESEATNEVESKDKDEDIINFEQFTVDDYNPQLGTDADYLDDDMNGHDKA